MGTIIFDLDGTLADTSRDLLAAANSCFKDLGSGSPLGLGDEAVAFQGGRAMLRLGFQRIESAAHSGDVAALEARVDMQYPLLLEAYADALDQHTTLYPGVVEAIEALHGNGYKTAICTNKPEVLAEDLLQRLGVRNLFGALVGADSLPVRKPDPEPYKQAVIRAGGEVGRSLLVGDTETDALTARAAGVPIILVSFGPLGRDVSTLLPDSVLEHFDHLPALVQRFL